MPVIACSSVGAGARCARRGDATECGPCSVLTGAATAVTTPVNYSSRLAYLLLFMSRTPSNFTLQRSRRSSRPTRSQVEHRMLSSTQAPCIFHSLVARPSDLASTAADAAAVLNTDLIISIFCSTRQLSLFTLG